MDLNSCFGVFYTIWVHLVPLVCLTKLHAKPGGVVQTFVPSSRVGIFLSECSRSTPLDPTLKFWSISNYFGELGTIWLPYETRCKTGRTSAKVRATKLCRTFRNERTRSTPLDSKLMFVCVLYYLGAFGTVWLPYKTWCKTSRSGVKVRATKSCQNFSQ